MTEQPAESAARIGRAIIDLRRNPYNRAIQRLLYSVGDHELTPVQVDILETIVAKPGQRMNELAHSLGVDASTVSRTILPLVALKLVERRTGEDDRRHTRLFPTEAGEKQAATIAQARFSMMGVIQSHFAPDRLKLFADLLEDYISALTIEGIAMLNAASDQP